MNDKNFEVLLKQKIGLDLASVGEDTVTRAVSLRMSANGLTSKKDYWERIESSLDELQELIEAVIVPETCFFRDEEAFESLASLVVQEWLPNHAGDTLHLLSAPCSTGEEPYSMVMGLLDAGLSADRIKVDAVDISVRSLARAQRGVYGMNSFRGGRLEYRDRYFEKTLQGYSLSSAVRNLVRFHHANLLSPNFHFGAQPYDVIFCRNVLIYFDRPAQESVLGALGRLLAPQGLLFVGPAEAFLATCQGFKSVNRSLTFAFRKRISVPAEQSPAPPARCLGNVRPPAKAAVPQPPKPAKPSLPSSAPTVSAVGTTLAVARSLADSGKLGEALAACEANLRQHGGSVDLYYLLALIHDAKGDSARAEEYYKRVLYLEPAHREALMHLALLSEKLGNVQGARRLRARAQRSEPGEKAQGA